MTGAFLRAAACTTCRQARKTEGWITGIRLASLAFKELGVSGLPVDIPKNPQYVLEYLFNEVLSRQTETMRRYLLSSSVLDRFCAPLCSALAATPEEDAPDGFSGWDFIAALRRENLFAINLDTENYWFRYHSLFHQLLKNQLGRHLGGSDIATLNSRASRWFADNGLIDEAIKHALRAADVPGAVRLLEQLSDKAEALTDPDARRDFHLTLASAAQLLKLSDELALKHLLAADAIGRKAQELLASLSEDQRSFNLKKLAPGHWWLI